VVSIHIVLTILASMECHCQGGTGFAIKCELKERPYQIIIVAIGISIFIFGYAMRAAEL